MYSGRRQEEDEGRGTYHYLLLTSELLSPTH